ncbi:hypothetical protein GCM10027516_14350 [Niabella aquatica]
MPLLILSFLLLNCNKKNEIKIFNDSCAFIDFKYYKGEKDNLGELSNDYLLVAFDTSYTDTEIKHFISSLNDFDQGYPYKIHTIAQYRYKEVPLKFATSRDCEAITQTISTLQQSSMVAYAHYTMQTDNCTNLIWEPIGRRCINSYGSDFYVKVKDADNLSDLNKMVTQTKTELIKKNDFTTKTYTIRATKRSKGDALAMANYFYESGLFEFSEPGTSKYPVE